MHTLSTKIGRFIYRKYIFRSFSLSFISYLFPCNDRKKKNCKKRLERNKIFIFSWPNSPGLDLENAFLLLKVCEIVPIKACNFFQWNKFQSIITKRLVCLTLLFVPLIDSRHIKKNYQTKM